MGLTVSRVAVVISLLLAGGSVLSMASGGDSGGILYSLAVLMAGIAVLAYLLRRREDRPDWDDPDATVRRVLERRDRSRGLRT